MAENAKSDKELEQEIEALAKDQTAAVSTEKDGESKTEAVETRTNKAAM